MYVQEYTFFVQKMCFLVLHVTIFSVYKIMVLREDQTVSGVSIQTYVLVLLFATGSWVVMNGIWVELPNLVNETPEGWKLASYLTIICQIANIGPIIYSLIKKRVLNKQRFERQTIIFIFLLGIFSCILLAFVWKKTYMIGTQEYSVWLMGLIFLIATVDCTSSVTFLPFMITLPSVYMSPMFLGESVSGFIPSLIALAQGIDVPSKHNTTGATGTTLTTTQQSSSTTLNFSQLVFFLLLAALVFISFICFLAISGKYSIEEPLEPQSLKDEDNNKLQSNGQPTRDRRAYLKNTSKELLSNNEETLLIPFTEDNMHIINSNFSPMNNMILLLWSFWLSFLQNGLLSAISSYAQAPYGTMTYHLATIFGSLSSGFVCFIFLWLPSTSTKLISFFSCLYTCLGGYVFAMAVMSPHPLLYDQTAGRIITVIISILMASLLSYSKVSIASIMRLQNSSTLLYYIGVAYQIGSFMGAILGYVIVNYTSLFED